MNMQIDYETERELGIDYETLAVKVADKVLEMEGCPYDAQVNLVLTDNEEIERVNTEFRDIARPTDVLSFPMIPFETPAGYDIVEEDESYFDLDTDELLLGDIMISVDKVFAQAEEYGHSVTREFCFLVAHSMLHLLGYDHMTPGEAAVMQTKQAKAKVRQREYQSWMKQARCCLSGSESFAWKLPERKRCHPISYFQTRPWYICAL